MNYKCDSCLELKNMLKFMLVNTYLQTWLLISLKLEETNQLIKSQVRKSLLIKMDS